MIDKMKRIKDFNIQYISGIWGDYASEDDKDGVFVLRSTEQKVNGDLKIISPAYIKTNYKSKNILKDGDLLITKSSGSRSHVGKCSYINKEVASFNYAFSNFMMGVRIKDKKLDSQYLCYCINSNFIKKQIEDSCTNVTLNNLNQKNVSNWLIPDFNMAKQNSIVFFLNKNIKVLNNIIEKYTKKIELLKEYKESLIYETVTKGLDLNAEMKDSGVDWLGKIPVCWDIKRVKNCVILQGGGSDKKINEGEKDVLLVNYTDVYKNKKIDKSLDFMKVTYPEDKIKNIQVYKNDLLITPTSETANDIGKVNIVLENMENTVFSYHILRMTVLKNSDPFYLKYYFNSFASNIQFSKKATGITRVTLSRNDILSNIVVLPPLDVQKRIVSHLDIKIDKVENEIKNSLKKIALIEELREAMIYEAVTGKIDVDTDGDKCLKMIDAL